MLVLFAAWVVIGFGAPAAIGQLDIVIHEEVDLGLRQLYVMVSDRAGKRVLGLEREDFELRDQGQPQQLVTFEGGDIPFTAVLLLDGSGSMRGGRLNLALAGARSFAGALRQHDEVRILVYSDRLLESTPWYGVGQASPDLTVEAEGGSVILDHLYLGLQMLEERQGRRVMILLSDGWDLQSVLDIDQLEIAARRSEVMLYWVRRFDEKPKFGIQAEGEAARLVPLSSWRDQEELLRTWKRLERVVRRSGGRVVRLEGIADVEGSFREILRELREQYALGYYPEGSRRDGTWREIEVTVDHPGARVRTREGYVDR